MNILFKPSINPPFIYYVSDTVPGTSSPHSKFKKSTLTLVLEMWELRPGQVKTPQPASGRLGMLSNLFGLEVCVLTPYLALPLKCALKIPSVCHIFI